MKICLINNLYPPYQKGGAERIVELTGQELKEQGQNVFLITTKTPFNKEKNESLSVYYLRSWYYYLDRIPLFFRLLWHIWDVFNLKNYLLIKQILDREKPDVIITHNLKGIGLLPLIPIKKCAVVHVHTLHDIQLLHPSGLIIYGEEKKLNKSCVRLYSFVARKFIQSPNLVISPSSWLIDTHTKKKFFPKSLKKVLPNPISSANKHREKISWNKNFFYFLYAGQLEKHKGILFLINAFKEYQEQFPNSGIKLVIVGNGSQFKKAYKIAHPNQIIFTGKTTPGQIRGIMRQAHCLLVPSQCYENSPTVIYEAIEFGLPIIASDLGGVAEIAQKGAVELFTPRNKKDLISKMNHIHNNYSGFRQWAEKQQPEIKKLNTKNYVKQLLSLIETQY